MEADKRVCGCIRRRCWCVASPRQLTLSQYPLLGTGGTVAGVGQYLKSMNEDVFVAIADPDGSGLCNKVKDQLNDYAYILLRLLSSGKIRSDVRSKGERRHEEETSS